MLPMLDSKNIGQFSQSTLSTPLCPIEKEINLLFYLRHIFVEILGATLNVYGLYATA